MLAMLQQALSNDPVLFTTVSSAFAAGAAWAGSRVGVKAQLNGTVSRVVRLEVGQEKMQGDITEIKVSVAKLQAGDDAIERRRVLFGAV